LNPHILPFHNYLKFEKRYSAHTVRSYSDDLVAFFEYLDTTYGKIAPSEITALYIRSWLALVKEQGASSRTINRKISTLKSFFKFQLKQGSLASSPMTQVSSPKASKRLPDFVKEKETRTLFKDIEFPNDWKGLTDKLVLKLLYQTGMRLSELINLRYSSIDFKKRQVKVLGKGNKERVLPLNINTCTELINYERQKKEMLEAYNPAYLLLTPKGAKLYAGYVYQTVRTYLALASTISKRSPHVLRHTFATHLMNNGADLNAVKDLLGHSSLAATQVYTHNTIEKLKNVYKKSHPKA
jgi:integrase/recombinase XerC